MTPNQKAQLIDRALVKSDRRHGGRRQTLAALEEDVLASGINASQEDIGRRAALLYLGKKIAQPLASLGEMATGLWSKSYD